MWRYPGKCVGLERMGPHPNEKRNPNPLSLYNILFFIYFREVVPVGLTSTGPKNKQQLQINQTSTEKPEHRKRKVQGKKEHTARWIDRHAKID